MCLHGSCNFYASLKFLQIKCRKKARNNSSEVKSPHGQKSANLLHPSDLSHLTWSRLMLCRVATFDPVSCLSAFFLQYQKDTGRQKCVHSWLYLGPCYRIPASTQLVFFWNMWENKRPSGPLSALLCSMSHSVRYGIPFTGHLEAHRWFVSDFLLSQEPLTLLKRLATALLQVTQIWISSNTDCRVIS